MRRRKTYGYKWKREVPVIDGTSIKPCKKCNLWFAAGKRMQVCDGCQRPARVVLRASVSDSKAKAQRGDTGTRVSLFGGEDSQVSESENRALALNKPTCPLPRLKNPILKAAHRREVAEGLVGCECQAI
jgi:hypothetical protein